MPATVVRRLSLAQTFGERPFFRHMKEEERARTLLDHNLRMRPKPMSAKLASEREVMMAGAGAIA